MNTKTMRAVACFLVASALAVATAGAATTATQRKANPLATRPTASFQEIMLAMVVPSSAALWNAVTVESTAEGVVEHKPTTDEDWLAMRHQALILIEAGNMLLDKGRPIVSRGAKVKDAEQPGILGPEQIRKAMEKDPARLGRLIHALQDAAGKSLAAIDNKDADALGASGGDIDTACEECHKAYWYPDNAQGKQ